MTVHVYRRADSESARELVWALRDEDIEAARLKRLPHPIPRRNPVAGDAIICWGEHVAAPNGVRMLNAAPIRNKLAETQQLIEARIPTVHVSTTRPPMVNVNAHQTLITQAETRAGAGAQALLMCLTDQARRRAFGPLHTDLNTRLAELARVYALPIPVQAEWVGRMANHVGGADLLNPPERPEYWVRKENLVREYRVHSFLGKSIRAGMKVRRDDFVGTPSTWVRSWDGGWRISYQNDPNPITNEMRELAHRAVAALGLQFGAVDLGQKADGSLIVLEVNRAPGVEGGTPVKYAQAIREWLRGQ